MNLGALHAAWEYATAAGASDDSGSRCHGTIPAQAWAPMGMQLE